MLRSQQLRCTALTLVLLMAGMLACLGAADAARACCPVEKETLSPCCCQIESQAALPAFSDTGLVLTFGAALPAVPVLFVESPRLALAQSLQKKAFIPNQRRRYLELGILLN